MVGKGKKGYHNVVPKDKVVHSQSARGIKQPQRIREDLLIDRFAEENRPSEKTRIIFIDKDDLFGVDKSSYTEGKSFTKNRERYDYGVWELKSLYGNTYWGWRAGDSMSNVTYYTESDGNGNSEVYLTKKDAMERAFKEANELAR